MGSHEPIHLVEIVAVLLDDDIAALLAIKKPVADWLFACRVTLANRQPAAYPRRADGYDSAQLARFHDLISLPVIGAVALLKVHRDAPGWIGCLGRGDHAAHAGRVYTRRLFHEDVLARFHRLLEMLRMQVWRRGDVDRIHIAGPHVVDIL